MSWDPSSQVALLPLVAERAHTLCALAERAIAAADARADEKVGLIERWLARLSEEPDAHARRAILEDVAHLFERELADADRALTAWIAAHREVPSRDAWWTLERLAAEAGRHAEVIEELEGALPALPEAQRAEAWARIGLLREDRLGQVDEALAAYAAALALEPDRREAHARRLALLRRADRPVELARALEALAAIELPAAAARCHLERAEVLARVAGADAAAAAYHDALAADPSLDEARSRYEAHLRGTGDDAGLAAFLAERLAVADDDLRAPLRRELAALEERLGRRGAAIAAWEAQRAAAPDDVDALRALERLYDQEGRAADLASVLAARVALVADPGERAAIYRRLAALWGERLGERAKATECLEWLLSSGGGDDETFVALARLYRADGKVRAAIDVMTRHADASSAPAVRAALFAEIAELYEREIGDLPRAIDLWEKAEALAADPLPARRALARLFVRHETTDTERALLALERALASGVADTPARLALARLYRVDGQLTRAAGLLADVAGAADAGDTAERVRVLVELAGLHDERDERERAIARYLEALALDPEHAEARERAADLLWRAGRHAELWPLAEQLAARAEHPRVRRDWLYRMAHAASEEGVAVEGAASALAVLIGDPDHDLPPAEHASIATQLGLAALRAGRHDEAAAWLAEAEGLAPGRRAVRLAEVELAGHTPESVARLAGVALIPADHGHLHRLLDACEARRAWAPALAVIDLLIGLERAPATRARYHLAAAALCAEELARPDDALAHQLAALADDPGLERAAEAAEAALLARGDHAGLLAFYMKRLGQLGPEADDGRRGERVRVWSAVAELCLGPLAERESGLTALEVAVELDGTPARRERLAALYLELGPDGRDRAIAEHQAILRADKGRLASYRALAGLYADAGREERMQACARAAALLAGERVEPAAARVAAGALDAEAWALLRHPDEDRLASALFAAVTPALAVAQARGRAPVPFRRGTIPPADDRPCMRALARVAARFGLPAPSAYPRPDLSAPVTFRLRVAGEVLVPELLLGAPLIGERDEEQAVVMLALALAHLRPERVARVISDDPAALVRVVDAVVALACDKPAAAGVGATLQLLQGSLSPLALDQLATVGHRLHARGVSSAEAVSRWLEAGEGAAARAALVVADVAAVWQRLEAMGAGRARLVDLAWASVTDELAEARTRAAAAMAAREAR